MNDDPLPSLRDTLLRRELTPEEERLAQEWIQSHPEAAEGWLEDRGLAHQLRRLPPAPIPSNFTSLVLAEIERERRREGAGAPAAWRPFWKRMPFRAWLGPGTALVALAVAVFAWHGQQRREEQEQARNLAALRALSRLSPATLADFDVIQRFGASASPVDFELLAALE